MVGNAHPAPPAASAAGPHRPQLSRRRLFRLSVRTGLGLVGLQLLAGCAPSPPAPSPPAAPTARAAAPAAKTDPPVKGGEIVLAFRTELPTLDPPVPNSDPQSRLINVMLDPLIWQVEAGKFHPGLAESWEVSPDARVYTFK